MSIYDFGGNIKLSKLASDEVEGTFWLFSTNKEEVVIRVTPKGYLRVGNTRKAEIIDALTPQETENEETI